ncbi:MAG: copper amine oxidase N-terminal domain-containing protein [Clostridia bacterium]|nr:copper amine oxidase N-terminal domain-containing protein [Clostridia bacterium]
MKKILLLLIAIISLLTISCAYAADSIKVQLNGEYLDFTDAQGNKVEPQLINNRTMVPLRKIFESLECEVDWNQETKTVLATKDDKEIKLTIDNVNAYLKIGSGDSRIIELDSAPVIIENRTLVPVRFIAESLEKSVDWDQENKTVIIIDYDKVLEIFKEKAPALKYIFDFKLNETKSYEFKSTINGTIKYSDSDDKKNNEELIIEGTINGVVNGQDVSLDIKNEITGKDGNILNALKDKNYDNINYKFVSKNGEYYIGTVNKKNKVEWKILENNDIKNQLDVANTINENDLVDYESLLNKIRENTEKVDINTYSNLLAAFEQIGKLITNDNIKLIENKGKTTFSLNFDIDKMILNLASNSNVNMDSQLDMKANLKMIKSKGVLSNEDASIELTFNAPNSKEKMVILLNIKADISKVNSEIKIEEPKI